MARLYADENFPRPAVEALRRLGHDALTTEEADQADLRIPDEEVLAFAHARGRALLTLNRRHFRILHKAGNPHSGLILCTEDLAFEALAARIDLALSAAGELTGQLIRVDRPPN